MNIVPFTAINANMPGANPAATPTRNNIIDKGSQMKEHTTVAVISQHFNKLRKITIIGDLAQLGPFVRKPPPRFSLPTELSAIF